MGVFDAPTHDPALIQRAFHVLSFLGHFYIHSQAEATRPAIIPASIAIPWCHIARMLDMPPVLTYSACVLNNWRYEANTKQVDHGASIDLKVDDTQRRQLNTLTTFTGMSDEVGFYLTMVRIERIGGPILRHIRDCVAQLAFVDASSRNYLEHISIFVHTLERLVEGIDDCTRIMAEVRQCCRPSFFCNDLRSWFNGPNGAAPGAGWHYEGVDPVGVTRSYGGPSAGQSSLLHCIDAFLGVDHQPLTSSFDDTFMRRMLAYMPVSHREAVIQLLVLPLSMRDAVLATTDAQLTRAYNAAVEALVAFRSEHIKIVTSYSTQLCRSRC